MCWQHLHEPSTVDIEGPCETLMLRSAEVWIRICCQMLPSCSLTVKEAHVRKSCLPNPHLAGNSLTPLFVALAVSVCLLSLRCCMVFFGCLGMRPHCIATQCTTAAELAHCSCRHACPWFTFIVLLLNANRCHGWLLRNPVLLHVSVFSSDIIKWDGRCCRME